MTDDGFAIEIALVGVLIVLNGFFSGSEIAVISARQVRIQALAQAGSRRAAALLRLKADPDRFLATVQIGVTMVGTLASAVGGVAAVERLEPVLAAMPLPWVKRWAEPIAVGAVVFAIAYLSLVVGELVPKSLALRHAEALALLVARPIDWLSRAASLAVATLTASTRVVLAACGQKNEVRSPFHTVEDIRAMLDEAGQQGLLDGQVVKGAVAFQECDALQIMTPRNQVVFISRSASLEEALRVARETGFSRYPVVGATVDAVEGVVHVRDLYEARERGHQGEIAALVQASLVVPETKKAKDLLTEMRLAQRHLALVVDEHGATKGIVTLEDIFEAIIGEIRDETDEEDPPVTTLGDGQWDVDGRVPVWELNSRYGLSLPESSSYVTVAGLVLDRLGTMPAGGETVAVELYSLRVTGMAGRRVAKVRIGKAAL